MWESYSLRTIPACGWTVNEQTGQSTEYMHHFFTGNQRIQVETKSSACAKTVQHASHWMQYTTLSHSPPVYLNGIQDHRRVWSVLRSVLWYCWLGSKKGIWPVKTEWWDAGMVICLGQGADLHMAQQMSLPLTDSWSIKSRLVLPFWHRLTRVVPGKVQRAIKQL